MNRKEIRLRKGFSKGIWPFTPDPGEIGLQSWASIDTSRPLFIMGNSRHEIGRCRRIAGLIRARVLCLDTGGVELMFALSERKVDISSISLALGMIQPYVPLQTQNKQKLNDEEQQLIGKSPSEEGSENEPSLVGEHSPELQMHQPDSCKGDVAILPYPVWLNIFGGEGLIQLSGWKIRPGPTDVADLPAYMAGGCQLSEKMKQPMYPLEERLNIAIYQAAFFIILAFIPLVFISWKALFLCALLALINTMLEAILQPVLIRIRNLIMRILFFSIGLSILSFLLALAWGLEWLMAFYFTVGCFLLVSWLGFQFQKRNPDIQIE